MSETVDPSTDLEAARRYLLRGEFIAAEGIIQTVIKQPANACDGWSLLGRLRCKQGRLEDAIAAARKAIEILPANASFQSDLGVYLLLAGRGQEGEDHLRAALQLQPAHVDANFNLGLILRQKGEGEEAARCFEVAHRSRPESLECMRELGFALAAVGRLPEARELLERVTEKRKTDHQVWSTLAYTSNKMGLMQQSIHCYQHVLQLRPDDEDAHHNIGCLYLNQSQFEIAEQHLQRTIKINPNKVEAYSNLGKAKIKLGQRKEGHQLLKKAVELNPLQARAQYNLGLSYMQMLQFAKAKRCYEKSLDIRPHSLLAIHNLAGLFREQGDIKAALHWYGKALGEYPDHPDCISNFLFALHYPSTSTPADIRYQHLVLGKRLESARPIPSFGWKSTASRDLDPRRMLRIGYVSADFRSHSVSSFLEPILCSHRRDDFKIFCYSNNRIEDEITQRLKHYACVWREIHQLDDGQAAQLIVQDEIDILVDCSGHTARNRLPVFALKPAPIQISYLGYPNITGLPSIDYRLVDGWTDPEANDIVGIFSHDPPSGDSSASEKLVRLPHGFLCYQPLVDTPEVSPAPFTRKGHITFGCFNLLAKISDAIIACWAQILHVVPNSKLLLKAKWLVDADTQRAIADRFALHGIDRSRLEMVGWTKKRSQHLTLYNQVDIALDTYPYHGTTTSCEAMWMGVPLITLAGQSHVSRVGVSLLSSIGLTDFIASSFEEYVEKARQLAEDPGRLEKLRQMLRQKMTTSALTDGRKMAASIEVVYRNIWQKWCSEESSQPAEIVASRRQSVSYPRQTRFMPLEAANQKVILECPYNHRLDQLLQRYPLYGRGLSILSRLISAHYADALFMDVGAKFGASASLARLAGCTMPILAVEPSRCFYTLLAGNISRNKDFFGSIKTVQAFGGVPASSISALAMEQPTQEAPMLSLDDLSADPVAIVKLDIDGDDASVIIKNSSFFSVRQPVLWAKADCNNPQHVDDWSYAFQLLAENYETAILFDNFGFTIDHGRLDRLIPIMESLLSYSFRHKQCPSKHYGAPTVWSMDICFFTPKYGSIYREMVLNVPEAPLLPS